MSARSKMLTLSSIFLLATALSFAATSSRTAGSYTQGLGVTFQQNLGQAPAPVRFMARQGAFNLYLNKDESVLQFFPTANANGTVLRTRLLGADPHSTVRGEEMQQGKVNYLFGQSDAKNITNIPTFAKVRYGNVYSGIDLVYYGRARQLEYDFEVAPGSDPQKIQMQIAGADHVSISDSGELVLQSGNRTLRWLKPNAYQLVQGKKVAVDTSYRLTAKNVGFAIGKYDRSRQLVIDPTLVFSTYLGGSTYLNSQDSTVGGDDGANAVAVDGSGNVYVAGTTLSRNYPTTAGAYQSSAAFDCRGDGSFCSGAFVSKLNPSGTSLIYSTYLAGTDSNAQQTIPWGIAVDGSGRAFVGGWTNDLPLTSNHISVTPCPQQGSTRITGFVTELNSSGTGLIYSTYFGVVDSCNESALVDVLALSSTGKVYVSGLVDGTTLPTKNAAFPQCRLNVYGTCADVFFAVIDPSQSGDAALVYSTYLGGSNFDDSTGIAVDGSGNAYLVGSTSSTDFPLAGNPYQSNNKEGGSKAWVAKINPAASGTASLLYSSYLGGSGGAGASAVAVDSSGNIYIAGEASTDFPTTPGAYQTSLPTGCFDPNPPGDPCSQGFLTKLNATGSSLVFSTYLGAGDGGVTGIRALAVDASHTAFITGNTTSSSFPTTSDAFQKACVTGTNGCDDAFLARFNKAGSGLLYSTFIGGTKNDRVQAIALTSTPSAVVAGRTDSSDFPVSGNALQKTRHGNADAFVMKFSFASATTTCSAPSTARTVHICSPTNGATVSSPVKISATAKAGSSAINVMQVYVDGVKKYEKTSTNTISTSLSMSAGMHRVTVQALDSAGYFHSTVNITVQ